MITLLFTRSLSKLPLIIRQKAKTSFSRLNVHKKSEKYSIISAGGFIFYSTYRLMGMLSSEWLSDVRYGWYVEYLTYVILAFAFIALLILFASNTRLFNMVFLAYAFIFEYEAAVDFDLGWHHFRVVVFGLCAILLILSNELFWTRSLIIASRFIWLLLCVDYTAIFIHMIQKQGSQNIALLYAGISSMLLISMSYSLDVLELFSRVSSRMYFVPSVFIVLPLIYAVFTSRSANIWIDIVSAIPLSIVAVSCSCFCKFLMWRKKENCYSTISNMLTKVFVLFLFSLSAVIFGDFLDYKVI